MNNENLVIEEYQPLTVIVAILNISYRNSSVPIKEGFTYQLNNVFSQPHKIICISVNKPLTSRHMILINSRAKLSDSLVFIQYEVQPIHHGYVNTLTTIITEKSTFPLDFEELALAVKLSNYVYFTQVKNTCESSRISSWQPKACDIVIGLVRARSNFSANLFTNIKNEVIEASQCTSYSLFDYIVDEEIKTDYELDIFSFQECKGHSWSNTVFINDYSGENMSEENDINELLNAAEDLLEQVNSYRQTAGAIDRKVECSTENYVPLDCLPFGEEMIRTKEIPEQLNCVIGELENEGVSKKTLENARMTVEEAEQTLADCTCLPVKDDCKL